MAFQGEWKGGREKGRKRERNMDWLPIAFTLNEAREQTYNPGEWADAPTTELTSQGQFVFTSFIQSPNSLPLWQQPVCSLTLVFKSGNENNSSIQQSGSD